MKSNKLLINIKLICQHFLCCFHAPFFVKLFKMCYSEREVLFVNIAMNKKIISAFILSILILSQIFPLSQLFAANETEPDYTVLRSIDVGTFNEYRYKITEKFFLLRDRFQLNNSLEKKTLEEIGVLADTGYKYLPDNLKNKNYLRQLLTDLQK